MRTIAAIALLVAGCSSSTAPAPPETPSPASTVSRGLPPVTAAYLDPDSPAVGAGFVVVLRSPDDVAKLLASTRVRKDDRLSAALRRGNGMQLVVARTTGCALATAAVLVRDGSPNLRLMLVTGSAPPECFRPYTVLAVFSVDSVPVAVTVDGKAPDQSVLR